MQVGDGDDHGTFGILHAVSPPSQIHRMIRVPGSRRVKRAFGYGEMSVIDSNRPRVSVQPRATWARLPGYSRASAARSNDPAAPNASQDSSASMLQLARASSGKDRGSVQTS